MYTVGHSVRPPALPPPSKLVKAPHTTKLPGPMAHLLDPDWSLCAIELSSLLLKPENRAPYK